LQKLQVPHLKTFLYNYLKLILSDRVSLPQLACAKQVTANENLSLRALTREIPMHEECQRQWAEVSKFRLLVRASCFELTVTPDNNIEDVDWLGVVSSLMYCTSLKTLLEYF
jgi:hypothetical protein